jgi:two-component system chemotaxis response regulator CheY
LRTKKILVVDNEPHVCDVLRKFLVSKGYSVVEAYDGDKALAVYSKEKPDLVLLDVLMPGKDGIETLREMRALNPKAGIIMVTAVRDEDVAQKAMLEGAYGYITKPFDPYYLERVLSRWFRRHAG